MNTRVIIDATWPIRSFEKVPKANGSKELLAQVSQNDWKREQSMSRSLDFREACKKSNNFSDYV